MRSPGIRPASVGNYPAVYLVRPHCAPCVHCVPVRHGQT